MIIVPPVIKCKRMVLRTRTLAVAAAITAIFLLFLTTRDLFSGFQLICFRPIIERTCPKVIGLIPSSFKLDMEFDHFFMNTQVKKFMDDHKSNCRPGRTLFAALLGNVRFLGLGSYVNNAANVFMIADDSHNTATYQAQFVIHDWEYVSLNTFFEDFAKNSPCPLFKDLSTEEFQNLQKTEANCSYLIAGNDSLALNSDEPLMTVINSPSFLTLIEAQKHEYLRQGTDRFFGKKSALLKSLWQPEASLKELLRVLWRNIMDEDGRFISVHLRRGDKLWAEAKEIPVRDFAQKICRVNNSACARNIYVMSDEESAFEEFRSYFNGSHTVYDLRTLMKCSGMNWEDFFVNGDITCRKRRATVADKSFWLPHTRQLIVEMTLLSMSNELICTFSSNICRLAALLRGSYEGDVHSMDVPTWDPW